MEYVFRGQGQSELTSFYGHLMAQAKEMVTLHDNRTMASHELHNILFSQGFGTRRVCAGLVQQGMVSVAEQQVTDPFAEFDQVGLSFTVQGVLWQYFEKAKP